MVYPTIPTPGSWRQNDILTAIRPLLLLGCLLTPATAGEPRVLPEGEFPADSRLAALRGERGDFLFEPAESAKRWTRRAASVRRTMQVTMGLWPLPTRGPLNAVIHGKLDLGEYTIEKVYFESLPGFYVTGNLYRPKGVRGRLPAILSPHGHFPGGRFQDEGPRKVARKIESGAEQFEDGGRSFMQSRCVQLARMGCVVFHYDMIGYADSVQIPLEVAHKFSGARVQFKQPPAQGLYSSAALLQQHNSLGLHTWNSVRALDFLIGLADVDASRIAVTGGSGGGTQTFLLCAIDSRPFVSVPVVIVSTTRQGGCTCENICGFHIAASNLEFTALHAPKPLLLISADDATRTMSQRGFPLLQRHYRNLGHAANAEHTSLLQFPHNYNHASRTAMYHFVKKHLQLGLATPIRERPFRRLTEQDLTVWNQDHPRPATRPEFEQQLLDQLSADAARQIEATKPKHDAPSTLDAYRALVGEGWKALLQEFPADPRIQYRVRATINRGTHSEIRGLLTYTTVDEHAAVLPIVQLVPNSRTSKSIIWLDSAGKAGLFAANDQVRAPIRRLLDQRITVIGVDLLYQGEFLPAGVPALGRSRWLTGEEAFAGWTYCYNLPVFAHRVHDVSAVIGWCKESGESVGLVGLGTTAPLAIGALFQSANSVDKAAVDTRRFRFEQLTDVYHPDFLPGSVKYGDLPGLLPLCAPTKLWVAGETDASLETTRSAYAAAGQPEQLTIPCTPDASADMAANWLLDW